MRNRAIRSKWGGHKNAGTDASASAGGTANRNAQSAARGNGPDPKQTFERYVEMAKAAASSGDSVESEKYYQYADHFLRLMNAAAR